MVFHAVLGGERPPDQCNQCYSAVSCGEHSRQQCFSPWMGGLLSGLFFIPSGRRVSYFTASGTLSVGEYHLDCVVYVCSSAAFWKSLPACISTGFQVFKLSTLQFLPSSSW